MVWTSIDSYVACSLLVLVVALAARLDLCLRNDLVQFLVRAAATAASSLDLVVLAHNVLEGAIVEVGATFVLLLRLVDVVYDDLLRIFRLR
jgi:hypothetical protein